MFSHDVAIKISRLLNKEAEEEIKILCDDLIQIEYSKLDYATSENEKTAALARVGMLKKFKEYKLYLENSIKHGNARR